VKIRRFEPQDENAVVALWEACGLTRSWNDPAKDIARKISDSPVGFLVGCEDGEIVGSVMVGYDGHRGWVNYLAVAPSARRQGYGGLLMAKAEAHLKQVGCPKLNLQVRSVNESVLAFYERLGYTREERVSFGKQLEGDES